MDRTDLRLTGGKVPHTGGADGGSTTTPAEARMAQAKGQPAPARQREKEA
ncbi:MAG: hypothetical protein INR71_12700 [Terriglobus roseus]|nr:hypothetical protein [Terriglobus roseus]